MQINTISDFRAAMRNGPYTWPGVYPLYFITNDGAALSFATVKAELRNIIEAIAHDQMNGWRVCAMDVNWEDTELYCEHTNERIESAYGKD